MEKNIRKANYSNILIMVVTFMVFLLSPRIVAFAGEINSNEAGVIAAASGTFEYDGKTYRAGSAYINSLTTYLSEDDVDLTAEQAQKAINEMNNSIADGVAQGYLYEVGGNGETVTSTTEASSNNKDKEAGDKTEEDGKQSEKPDDGSVDVWGAMSNQTEAKRQLKNRPSKKDADASVKLDEDKIVVTTKDKEIVELDKKEQLVSPKLVYTMDVIAGIVLAITLICVIILLFAKCMVFVMPKSRHARPGHTKRRKIRRYTRNVLTVTTMISFASLFVLIGIYLSLFNKDKIMQNMQASGYFRYAYSEYVSGIANGTESNEGNVSVDENGKIGEAEDTDSIVSYESYVFTIKQNSMKILNGETNIRIPDSNVSPYISNVKKTYATLFKVSGVMFIVSAILGIVFMIFMDQRRERGVKHIAFAELVSSVIVVCITIYMSVAKPYTHLYIEPDYLYLFIMQCIKWSVKVMTSISAFSVVLGMLLVGVYQSLNNKAGM